MHRPRTNNEWALLGTTTAQAVCTTALDIVVLLKYLSWVNPVVYQVPWSHVVPMHFAVYVLGNVYQAVLAIDALRLKNNLQLFGICILNIGLFISSIMRYGQTEKVAVSFKINSAPGDRPFVKDDVDFWGISSPALVTSSVVMGVCTIMTCALVYIVNCEFRWAIYRRISGSLDMLRRYFAYQVLLVLIQLGVYFLTAFVIAYGLIIVNYIEPEFSLTLALIPAILIQVALTIYFTRNENTIGAIFAIVLRMGEMAYLLNRILSMTGNGPNANTYLRNEMLLFSGVALILATAACLNAMLCVANFGKGLKPLLMNSGWKRTSYTEFEPVSQHRYSERIELD